MNLCLAQFGENKTKTVKYSTAFSQWPWSNVHKHTFAKPHVLHVQEIYLTYSEVISENSLWETPNTGSLDQGNFT